MNEQIIAGYVEWDALEMPPAWERNLTNYWLKNNTDYDGELCEHGRAFFEPCSVCDARALADLHQAKP